MGLDPKRTVTELEELRDLTGNEDGAQRVAWTDTWRASREWLRGKVAATGATEEIDQAGNQWFTLQGASDKALLIGGHIDSVPNGGWLDGCLNVLAGVGGLRRVAAGGTPPVPRPAAQRGGGGEGAVCTSGGVVCKPGIVTSVVETAEQLLDQRHLNADSLARLLSLAKDASERFAAEEDLEVSWERIWSIEPILFDANLVELADQSIREVSGTSHRLPS